MCETGRIQYKRQEIMWEKTVSERHAKVRGTRECVRQTGERVRDWIVCEREESERERSIPVRRT